MAKKYLDYDGLLCFWQKIKANFTTDVTYDSSSKKIQKTKAGTTSDVVTLSTVATSGSYNDLTDKPTVTSGVSDVQSDGASVVTDGVANIDTFVGATTSTDGTKGLVPAPESVRSSNLRNTFLCIDGSWKEAGLSVSRISNGSLLILLNGTGVIVPVANTTQNGVMSASDKEKLDGITYTGVSDVMVEGNSVMSSGVAEIEGATSSAYGVVKLYGRNASELQIAGGLETFSVPRLNNGLIDTSVLPSYVDDVIEAYARNQQTALSQNWLSETSASGDALTPEAGKIYILMNDTPSYAVNSQFRWAGTTYVKLADGGISSITNAEIDAIVAA